MPKSTSPVPPSVEERLFSAYDLFTDEERKRFALLGTAYCLRCGLVALAAFGSERDGAT